MHSRRPTPRSSSQHQRKMGRRSSATRPRACRWPWRREGRWASRSARAPAVAGPADWSKKHCKKAGLLIREVEAITDKFAPRTGLGARRRRQLLLTLSPARRMRPVRRVDSRAFRYASTPRGHRSPVARHGALCAVSDGDTASRAAVGRRPARAAAGARCGGLAHAAARPRRLRRAAVRRDARLETARRGSRHLTCLIRNYFGGG